MNITRGLTKEVKKVREDVFMKEQGFICEFDEIDKDAYHIVLYLNDEPAATGRTYPKEDGTCYMIGRIAVQKQYRKLHLGKKVVNYLEIKAKSQGAKKTALSAQVSARGFYEKIGYQASGEIYLDEKVEHIYMEKQIS